MRHIKKSCSLWNISANLLLAISPTVMWTSTSLSCLWLECRSLRNLFHVCYSSIQFQKGGIYRSSESLSCSVSKKGSFHRVSVQGINYFFYVFSTWLYNFQTALLTFIMHVYNFLSLISLNFFFFFCILDFYGKLTWKSWPHTRKARWKAGDSQELYWDSVVFSQCKDKPAYSLHFCCCSFIAIQTHSWTLTFFPHSAQCCV